MLPIIGALLAERLISGSRQSDTKLDALIPVLAGVGVAGVPLTSDQETRIGTAGYWDARQVQLLSRLDLMLAPYQEGAIRHTDTNIDRNTRHYRPSYDFIIISIQAKVSHTLDQAGLLQRAGRASLQNEVRVAIQPHLKGAPRHTLDALTVHNRGARLHGPTGRGTISYG